MFEFLLCLACSLSQNGQYEESKVILDVIPKNHVIDNPKYHFYNMVNAYKLMDDKTVEKEAEFFEDAYYFSKPIPRRYITVAYLMASDIEAYKNNPVRQIDRKMAIASQRLNFRKAGKQTQKLQKEILDDLDRLIKEKEQAVAKAAALEEAKKEEKRKQQEARQKIVMPALEDYLPSGEAKGEIDQKKFKEYSDVWGKLPEHQRTKAMVELTRGLPPKYKQAIETYFKKLETDNRNKRYRR